MGPHRWAWGWARKTHLEKWRNKYMGFILFANIKNKLNTVFPIKIIPASKPFRWMKINTRFTLHVDISANSSKSWRTIALLHYDDADFVRRTRIHRVCVCVFCSNRSRPHAASSEWVQLKRKKKKPFNSHNNILLLVLWKKTMFFFCFFTLIYCSSFSIINQSR